MKTGQLLLLVSMLVAGCSNKPTSTIDHLVEFGANGDIHGLNLLLDKDEVNADLIGQAIVELKSSENLTLTDANMTFKQAEGVVKTRVWNVIDADVRKGKIGLLANMQIIRENVVNKTTATVLAEFVDGKQTTFRLSMTSHKWLISGLDLNMFKKIDAKPSFTTNKIKILQEFVGKHQDDKFHNLIRRELQSLLGRDYDTLMNNMSVSGAIKKEGRYIVIDGNAPLYLRIL